MGKKASGFLEKTLLAIVAVIRETVVSDTIALQSGFLQQCDPRIKLAGTVVLLSTALLARSPAILALLYGLCLALGMLSAISLPFFLKRTLLFIPLFALLIAIPSLFSPFTPGTPLLTIFPGFAITRQGIDSATIFCLRVLVSVSFAVLLVLTTRHHALLKALRFFRVPRIFVLTANMTYRYIFVLLDIVTNTFTGIKSRTGGATSGKSGRTVVTQSMAGLWLRSYRMHQQVYDAMVSRGFNGEPVMINPYHISAKDILLLVLALFSLIGTLWLNRFLS